MEEDLAALARCVGDVDAFAARHWGREPLLRRGAGPFDDLLDLDAVDALLAAAARRPTFRLVQDGSTIPTPAVTQSLRMGGATVDEVADLDKIGAAVAGGATVVLQGLQRTWLPLARFCRSLERATGHPVQANAYLSPSGAAGLARHEDTHDVLALQVLGAKGWDVEGLGALTLEAGDVLYLPAGTGHSAAADEVATLHVTIGILRDTYGGALRRLLDRLGPDVGLTDPLPLAYATGSGQAALVDGLRRRLDGLAGALVAVDATEVAGREAARSATRRKPLLTGHLRSVLALGDLDGATVVRRRVDAPATLDDGAAGRVVLALVDRTLDLPAHCRPALELLLAGDPVPVSALPGLDDRGQAVLARRLVREGLLELA